MAGREPLALIRAQVRAAFTNPGKVETMGTFGQKPLFEELERAGVLYRDFHTTLAREGTWLSQDEACVIESAFELILPEQRHGDDRCRVQAANYVESQILAQTECIIATGMSSDTPDISLSSAQIAEVYRFGIAAMQRHCMANYGARFQDLPISQQHVVLGILEQGCEGNELGTYSSLFQLMLQHASQVYFELTHVVLQRRRCALKAAAKA